MPEHAEESAECNWLLAFPTESGGKPPESTESLPARVERLEQALDRSTREIESLKSELATLVGTVDDIGDGSDVDAVDDLVLDGVEHDQFLLVRE